MPSDAVQTLNGGSVVFTPTGKPGEFAATPVKTGETVDGMTQITDGLQPGQSYRQQERLRPEVADDQGHARADRVAV